MYRRARNWSTSAIARPVAPRLTAITGPYRKARKSDTASPWAVVITLIIQKRTVICGTLLAARRPAAAAVLSCPSRLVVTAARMPYPSHCLRPALPYLYGQVAHICRSLPCLTVRTRREPGCWLLRRDRDGAGVAADRDRLARLVRGRADRGHRAGQGVGDVGR